MIIFHFSRVLALVLSLSNLPRLLVISMDRSNQQHPSRMECCSCSSDCYDVCRITSRSFAIRLNRAFFIKPFDIDWMMIRCRLGADVIGVAASSAVGRLRRLEAGEGCHLVGGINTNIITFESALSAFFRTFHMT